MKTLEQITILTDAIKNAKFIRAGGTVIKPKGRISVNPVLTKTSLVMMIYEEFEGGERKQIQSLCFDFPQEGNKDDGIGLKAIFNYIIGDLGYLSSQIEVLDSLDDGVAHEFIIESPTSHYMALLVDVRELTFAAFGWKHDYFKLHQENLAQILANIITYSSGQTMDSAPFGEEVNAF